MKFAGTFLNNLMLATSQELDKLSTIKGQAIRKKQLRALQVYIPAKYMDDSKSMTEGEYLLLLKDNTIGQSTFSNFISKECFEPFRKEVEANFEDIYQLLSGKVYAINEKDLLEMIGGVKHDKAFRFILDCFGLSKVTYHFESFKDTNLETIYSNDDLNFDESKSDKNVTTFFRFFIDGDWDKKNKVYDSEKYYGSLPVQESRLIAYCKQKGIPQNYVNKLLAIVKCSARFNVGENGELSLKKQYLHKAPAIAPAILFEYGKPMRKDELLARINKLRDQYPVLIEKRINEIHDERNPFLCAAGEQGSLQLQTWKKDDRDKYSIIRDFVADTFAKTQEAVPLDQIVAHLHTIGFNYPKKSVQTFVTDAGCKSKGRGAGAYYPADSELGSNDRFWKTHILRREAAEYLLEHNRQASRNAIKDYITKKYNHSVNVNTIERALFELEPCYFTKVGKGTGQKVALSEKIANKRDIKIAFPEPEKKEVAYSAEIRNSIINYLIKNEKALQKDLVELFYEKTPSHLQDRRGPVRIIMKDDAIFLKEKLGDKQIQITLQPRYIEKLKLAGEYSSPIISPSPVEKQFSWDGLKKGIITIMSTQEYDERLPHFVDNMLIILRGGYDDLLPTSNFDDLVQKLYKYVTDKTSLEERRGLRKEILLMMETYLKEFHRLMYHDSLNEYHSFYELKVLFIQKGLLPVKPDRNSGVRIPEDLFKIATAVERINVGRNSKAHSKAFESKDDKQTISDIHDCLLIMLHLAKKLNYTAEKSTLNN